jgi:hypothetical protein
MGPTMNGAPRAEAYRGALGPDGCDDGVDDPQDEACTVGDTPAIRVSAGVGYVLQELVGEVPIRGFGGVSSVVR